MMPLFSPPSPHTSFRDGYDFSGQRQRAGRLARAAEEFTIEHLRGYYADMIKFCALRH